MRLRFQPPVSVDVDLIIRAGITDSADREPEPLDYSYWRAEWPGLVARGVEINVADYAWKRLIGWQAGGADVARYGPFATPPNAGPPGGWVTPLVDVGLVDVVPVPVLPDLPPSAALALARLEAQIEDVLAKLDQLAMRSDQNTDRIQQHIAIVVKNAERSATVALAQLEALVAQLKKA